MLSTSWLRQFNCLTQNLYRHLKYIVSQCLFQCSEELYGVSLHFFDSLSKQSTKKPTIMNQKDELIVFKPKSNSDIFEKKKKDESWKWEKSSCNVHSDTLIWCTNRNHNYMQGVRQFKSFSNVKYDDITLCIVLWRNQGIIHLLHDLEMLENILQKMF